MAIQTAEQWLSQQMATPSATPTSSKKKKKEEEQSPTFQDFMGTKLSFLEEPDTMRPDSWIPDWNTGQGVVDFVGNNLINPAVKPLEQFARMIPAVGYEGARAIDVATMGDNPDEERLARIQRENPFMPGIEKTEQGDIPKVVGLRTGKAMLDLLTLGKGGALLKGGNSVKKMIAEGALSGAMFPATQTEAPTVGEEAFSTGAGAILGPIAGKTMEGAKGIINKLLNKVDKSKLDDITLKAMSETPTMKSPTPFEIAQGEGQTPNLLDSVMGKAKEIKSQVSLLKDKTDDVIEAPVLGDNQIEMPFIKDMPEPIQNIANIVMPDAEDVTPKHVPSSIANVPIEKRHPGMLTTVARELWTPIQGRLKKMGATGEKLSQAIDDFRASEYNMRGKAQIQINQAFKNLKLTDDEAVNFWEAAQGMASPMNDKVIKAVEQSRVLANHFYNENVKRGLLDNMVDHTGSPIIDPNKYLSHMLNDKGYRALEFDEQKFFDKMTRQNMKPGDEYQDVFNQLAADWKFIESARTPKSFFEKKRTWRIPPEYLERDPQKLWSSYNATASKRYALLEKFGAPFEGADESGNVKTNYPKIKEFLGGILQDSGLDDKRYAEHALDLIINRAPTDTRLKKAVANLTEFQLISKLTPLTTVPNLSQGFTGSIYQHGVKNAIQGLRDTFTKEGADFATKTGLIGQGFYTPARYNNMTKIWGKITGFPFSEDFNFRVATNSAKHFLQDMYTKLEKAPMNKDIRKHFEFHGLNADELLKQKGLTEDDLLKGAFIMARDTIFPRLVEQAPMWTQNPMAKLIYQFSHFSLKQPQMLAKQFGVSKKRGFESLVKFLAAQAVTGEVTSDIWSLIQGRERPEAPIPRLLENLLYSGAGGVPAEIIKGTFQPGESLTLKAGRMAQGPTFSSLTQSAERIGNDMQAGDFGKAMEDLIRARVRGDIPVGGPPIPAGSFFERFVPREDLERKKESSGFQKINKMEGMKKFKKLN